MIHAYLVNPRGEIVASAYFNSDPHPPEEGYRWVISEPLQGRLRYENGRIVAERTLEELKQDKLRELDQWAQATITAGFVSEALGAPHRYSSQLEDQINLLGAAIAGVDLDYVCTDAAGVKAARRHTAAQIRKVYEDGLAHKASCIYRYHRLAARVEQADSPEALQSISWLSEEQT